VPKPCPSLPDQNKIVRTEYEDDFESAPDVGETWYWNCHPGARFDSESVSYAFSFDQGILNDWPWNPNYYHSLQDL
jgi:cation diffusion facilitator CzcD-associated flavoprotein CzcO